jgi:hypothetical protein
MSTEATLETTNPLEWDRLCEQLTRNDPTITSVKFNGQGLACPTSYLRSLSAALRHTHYVQDIQFRNMIVSLEGAMLVASLLQSKLPPFRALVFNECMDDESYLADALPTSLLLQEKEQQGDGSSTKSNSGACLQVLHFDSCWNRPTVSVGSLLTSALHLVDLHLCYNPLNIPAARSIALGIATCCKSLQTLDLTGSGMDCASMRIIAQGIQQNHSIASLRLDFNAFGDDGVHAIATMLRSHPSLISLHLFGNRISSQGATYLADALVDNTVLQTLMLALNQMGDGGAAALARALTYNTTLTTLSFPSNAVGVVGMLTFAYYLPHMKGLEQLNVGLLLDDCAADALLEGLRRNHCLSELFMEKVYSMEEEEKEDLQQQKDIDFYLRLNRSGRRLLYDAQVETSLWSHVLSRAASDMGCDGAPDVLNYLVQAKPDLILEPQCYYQ